MQSDIREIIDRETRAWDAQDVELLLTVFHPDFVWVWPADENAHDPIKWETVMGRFDYARWKQYYTEMFDAFSLERNERKTVHIVETEEKDGGFAVVDIDTLWRNRRTGVAMHWIGRTCKTYVRMASGYKMIAQTGVLNYEH